MTMRELAKLANVSVSAVSKAFHDADDISSETKAHIFELAKKHGCYGKFYKERFPKKVIAIICAELNSGHYSSFVTKLQEFIEESGNIAVVSNDHFDADTQAELIDYYASYIHVDGIIVLGLRTPIKRGYDIPIVALFSTVDTSVDSVRNDMEGAMREAVSLLSKLEHKNIAFISEHLTKSTAALFERIVGERKGISAHLIHTTESFEKAGEEGIKHLLAKKCGATAIICAYDEIAIGAIKELKRNGFSVPDDISVIGIDNIQATAYTETGLTTIDMNPDEICMIAWDLILKKQENKFYKNHQQITLACKLIVRESVGPAKVREEKTENAQNIRKSTCKNLENVLK